jgi:1-deoxy-D-xylulose-5-phosphate synthase
LGSPAAVRYPRGKGPGVEQDGELLEVPVGKARVVRESTSTGKRVAILGFGLMVERLRSVADDLHATLVDMRFVKPIDEAMIEEVAKSHDLIVTGEDGVVMGGAGTAVLEVMAKKGLMTPALVLGIEDHFVDQGTTEELFEDCGLGLERIKARILERLGD